MALNIRKRQRMVLIDLVRNGASTATEISSRTGIGKNKVYGFIADLNRSQLVRKSGIVKRETVYTIVPENIRTFIETEKSTVENLAKEIGGIEKSLEIFDEKIVLHTSVEIWLGQASDAIKETRRLIERAKSSIRISSYVFEWFTHVQEILMKKLEEGVSIQVLMSNPYSELLSVDHKEEIKTRAKMLRSLGIDVHFASERSPFRGTIVDEIIFLIMMFSYNHELNKKMATGFCVCSNNAIAGVMVDYFRSLTQTEIK